MLCIFAALAQSKNGDMQGHVKDVNSHPLASVSVYLLNAADSAVLKFTVSDKNGSFVFAGVKPGNYLVSLSGIGYKATVSPTISFRDVLSLDIGIIQLKTNTVGLGPVNILAPKSFIEMKADKVILNIRSSDMMIGNNALEVLGKSPGVQVDNNDNISLYGRSDALVMIDNKPTYLSGSALSDLLRGIQSSMIDKIELISDPNATYDAAGTGGVINIRMVRDKNLGINAQLTASAALAQFPGGKYSGYRGNAGINFNYRTSKLNVFGSYTYGNSPAYRSILTNRLDSYLGQTDIIDVDLFINQRRVSNSFRIGADIDITPKQTIGFLISDVVTNQDGPKTNKSVISNNVGSQNVVDSTVLTNSMLDKGQANVNYNVNYQADMGKKGMLTLNADYIKYRRTYYEEFLSNYYYSYDTTPYRSLWQQNNSPLNYNGYVFSGNYRLDLNTTDNFTAGFKLIKTKIDNTSGFGSVAGSSYNINPGFTGEFNYTEDLGAMYVDYNHMFNKNTAIELGARIEETMADSKTIKTGGGIDELPTNYFGFFPNVKLTHIINADNHVQLSYSRRINRPKYEDINPLVLYNDQFTYQIGNPYLKPYYSNLLEIKHLYKDKFIAIASFEAVNGFTQVVYMQNDKTQTSQLKKQNLGNRYNYTLNFLAPLTISKCYGVDISADFKYQQFTGTSSLGDLNNGSVDITFRVVQHVKLPLHISADLGAYYETPTTFGIYRYKEQYYAYGNLNKAVFKKGNIHLDVDNIFNSDKGIYTSHYQNLNLSSTQIDRYRIITLGLSYPLGSQSIKASRKKDSEADDEQNRISSGSN